jgi:hypothetical protein
MPTPFKGKASLELPGTPGLAPQVLEFLLDSQYASKAEYEYELPASSGSQSVNFGSMPSAGAKAVLIHYESRSGAPPVLITVNGGNQPVELSTGGSLFLGSPAPVNGVTSMSIAYTGAGRVRVWLLGG